MSVSRQQSVDPFLSVLGAGLVFLGLIGVLAVASSLAGWAISAGAAAATAGLSLAGGALYWRLFNRPEAGTAPAAGTGSGRLSRPVKVLAALAALIYISLWLLAYALPDFSYDGLWYHIPAMHFWGLAGRVHWITAELPTAWDPLIDNSLNGFPKGAELVTFVLIRATGLTRLANAVNLPFLPLGALSLIVLSRRLGANRNFSVLSGALFFFIPVNIGQAITSYVDTATAAVYIAAFALLAETLARIRRGELFWRGLPALGAAAGLAMGAKTPGIVFPLLFAVILGAAFLPAGGRRNFRTEGLFFRAGGFIGIFLAIAVLVGGYWPIRNYVHAGNPINPVGVEIAGRTIFPDHSWPGQFRSPYWEGTEDWPQARRIFSGWLSNFRDWWPITTYCDRFYRGGGLGRLWFFGSIPALVVIAAAAFSRRIRNGPEPPVLSHPGILFVLILFSVLLFHLMPPHHNHLARYSIWLYGVGLPAFALAGGATGRARRRAWRVAGRIWVLGTAALAVAEGAAVFIYNLEMSSRYWPDRQSPPALVFRLRRSLTQPYPSGFAPGSLMDTLVSGRAAAGLGPLRERRVLLLGRLAEGEAFGRREIYFLDSGPAAGTEDFRRYLEKRELRFVVWDDGIEIPATVSELSSLREPAPGGFRVLAFAPAPITETESAP